MLEVHVVDSGRGITNSEMSTLFNMFGKLKLDEVAGLNLIAEILLSFDSKRFQYMIMYVPNRKIAHS